MYNMIHFDLIKTAREIYVITVRRFGTIYASYHKTKKRYSKLNVKRYGHGTIRYGTDRFGTVWYGHVKASFESKEDKNWQR